MDITFCQNLLGQYLILFKIKFPLPCIDGLDKSRLVEVLEAFLEFSEHQIIGILYINAQKHLQILVLHGRLLYSKFRQLPEELLGREEVDLGI